MRILPVILICIGCLDASAQDTHYWSQQAGPRSSVLGGAVVAGVRDNSALFYNPGALGLIRNKNISVSATGYEFDQVYVKNGAGTGIDLRSRTLQAMPLIISGIFRMDSHPRHTLGYCLITRDQFNIKMAARNEGVLNVLNDLTSPGPEDYIGQYTFRSSVYEMLTGWAYGYKISEKVSAGIGNYGAYRSYRADTWIATRAVPVDSASQFTARIASYDEMKSIELKNIRTVFKAGIAVDLNRLKIGLTITSPSINVLGWSTVGEDIAVHDMDISGSGIPVNFVASDRQEGLASDYKTPPSIALGLQYTMNTTMIGAAFEWFGHVASYNMVTPDDKDLVKPTGIVHLSSAQYLRISEYKRSVFNLAVCIEKSLGSKYVLGGSFRTNQTFTVRDSLSDVRVNFTDWNISHFVAGLTRKKEKSDITAGLAYATGHNQNRNQWINLSEPVESRFLTGPLGKTSVKYSSVSLIIGYTYYFR